MTQETEVIAAQAEAVLQQYPQGAQAIALLAVARNLVSRFRQRPGVGSDECLDFLRAVETLIGPP